MVLFNAWDPGSARAVVEAGAPAVATGLKMARPDLDVWIVDALRYVLRGGIAWRALPHDYPPWQTAYHYFRAWRLDGTWERLNDELRVSLASNARVYYIIGREDELLKKGVIVKEGGMNLLVGRVGKTVQASRSLDPSVFTAIDARQVSTIPMPDSTRTYRVISRQSRTGRGSGGERSSIPLAMQPAA